MEKKHQIGQTVLTAISAEDLLFAIGKLLDEKLQQQPAKQSAQSDTLSRKQAADMLKITLPTLREWTKLGLLKAYKLGAKVFYKEAEIREALDKGQLLKGQRFLFSAKPPVNS